MSGGNGKVTIYSRTGEKLCDIQAPQKWHWPIPIPPVVIYRHDVWKDPEAVKRWAWQQAGIVTLYLNEHGIVGRGVTLPSDTRCRCLVCGQNTCAPIARHWFWSSNYTFLGFACSNRDCGMFMVLVPKVLMACIDEMPTEYLPWAETKAKSDREQS
jgi:hypothetical protein